MTLPCPWDSTKVRDWAKSQGIDVKDHSRIPAELIIKFKQRPQNNAPGMLSLTLSYPTVELQPRGPYTVQMISGRDRSGITPRFRHSVQL